MFKPRYKKKGEVTPEREGDKDEVKNGEGEEPKQHDREDRRGGRGRGGRGRGRGRGGDRYERRGGYRQKTAGEGEDQELAEGEERKHTAYEEYYYGKRTRYDYRIELTAETEVPVVPAKEERLKPVDKPEFEKKMRSLDNQVDKLRDQIRKINMKKKDLHEGAKVSGSDMTYRDLLRKKIDEIKELKNNKREVVDEIRAANGRLDEIKRKKDHNFDKMHREYRYLDEIKKAIHEKKTTYETTTLSKKEELRMIKDIGVLEKSVPFAEANEKLKPDFDEARKT